MNDVAIIIPARFGSTRFPGKPLEILGGRSVLAHVVERAHLAAEGLDGVRIAVATDDERIADHALSLGVDVIMTPSACATGSDRAYAAAVQMVPAPDIVINLQGDAPFIPVAAIRGVIERLRAHPEVDVATPAIPLTWAALDTLRAHKEVAPHSGTTVVLDKQGRAMWFSKSILPTMRHEDKARAASPDRSPVHRHLGLYGYRIAALTQFVGWPESLYEGLECLEQLRMLENGLTVHVVAIDDADEWALGGIDTPADLARANEYIEGQNRG